MPNASPSTDVRNYVLALGVVGVATLLSWFLSAHAGLTNIAMIYLLATLFTAMRGRHGPAAFSSALSVLCFDFFFVPPRFTFTVAAAPYVWTFAVMFATAMTISHLTIRLRQEAEAARESEQRTAWLMEKAKKAEVEAETEHLRSSLLSAVSHDLRTPLAAIVGSAGALQAKESIRGDVGARELLANIVEEGERLSRLVQNLLEATRLESAAVQLRKERYPLEEVVGSALEHAGPALAGRQVRVAIPEDFPAVPLDPVLIEQVLINLLENAARYSPVTAELEIAAVREGSSAQVSVADAGPGIRVEDLERVFDKFFRDDHSKGAGLGLAIALAIVKAHGGRIWAENRPAGGALFQFTLPMEAP